MRNMWCLLLLFIVLILLIRAQITIDSIKDEIHEEVENVQDETQRRMKALINNIMMIEEHNELFNRGKFLFKLQLNEYAEMENPEFVSEKNGFIEGKPCLSSSRRAASRQFTSPQNVLISSSVNWVDAGAVTPVANQGSCGACAIAGQLQRRTGRLVALSEQYLIDCSRPEGNRGCQGGFMEYAYDYVIRAGGIVTNTSYPYEARNGECRTREANIDGLTGFKTLQRGNESQLMEAVATIGPIAVAMDASRPTFQFYSEGIYYDPLCSSDRLDHAVLVVGYGTSQGIDYWLVKNSYGVNWGENGYFRIARNRNNHCGIATYASYPILN